MPKSTFFNIPLEKQKRIIDIAIEEFTTKSFEHASVNSIIKKAGIPRGSFYTYFEDLDELFNYIIIHVKEERFKYAKDFIRESNGDFFMFINKLFAYDFDSYSSQQRYSLFRNYVHYIQISNKGTIKKNFINPLTEVLEGKMTFDKIFDIQKYSMSISEFIDLVEMTMIIMINTYLKSESENLDKEEVITLFKKRMKLLEYGALKKNNGRKQQW